MVALLSTIFCKLLTYLAAGSSLLPYIHPVMTAVERESPDRHSMNSHPMRSLEKDGSDLRIPDSIHWRTSLWSLACNIRRSIMIKHTCCLHIWQQYNVYIIVQYYRMAGNFAGKIFWQIAEIMTFGGVYFGGWESLAYNDIHSKRANRTHWEFNRAVS